MSLENHPNFHTTLFLTETIFGFYEDPDNVEKIIRQAYFDSLRGKANMNNCPDISGLIERFVFGHPAKPTKEEYLEFVFKVEDRVEEFLRQ